MSFRSALTIVGFHHLAEMSHSYLSGFRVKGPRKCSDISKTKGRGGGGLAFPATHMLAQVALSSCCSLRIEKLRSRLTLYLWTEMKLPMQMWTVLLNCLPHQGVGGGEFSLEHRFLSPAQ